jgi:putative phosphoribosyl transferase
VRTFDALRDRQLDEIQRRRAVYLRGRPAQDLKGRIAIVVDDGVATGATTRAALQAVRASAPAQLVLATPVAPTEVLAELQSEADEVVCLETHQTFGAIGFYYDDFSQVSDQEVVDILARFAPLAKRSRPAERARPTL